MITSKFNRLIISLLFCAVVTATGAEKILVMRSSGTTFEEVASSIVYELNSKFEVKEEIVDETIKPKETAKLIEKHDPKLVVLMNTPAVRSFRDYQEMSSKKDIPSLSLMTSLLPGEIKGMKNSVGISSEVPIVTSVVNLRAILGIEKVRLGVVYREFLKTFVDENAEFCKKENIEMVRGFVPEKEEGYGDDIQLHLDLFMSPSTSVDVIWVPNDPEFLKPEIIRDVWIPFSEKSGVPIIVGVERMLATNINFGTYAVFPDHIALGQQASELIFEIQEKKWSVETAIVEPPISIYQVINPAKIQNKYNVTPDTLFDVDKVVE